ncbi:MAG: DUF1987 domain-containing protein [Vicingaceae bacterium]
MEDLILEKTEHTPEVSLKSSGTLAIKGRSFPEDVGAFFDPITQWMEWYVGQPANNTEFSIYFDYYNSSTARRITELIFELENIQDNGKAVKVIWYYKPGDVIMQENGEEIKSVVNLPFELKEAPKT